jgi:SAM-dependent methyltransferase
MDALEMYNLGRKLMRISEEAIAGPTEPLRLTPAARLVMMDVFENPDTTAAEIAERTGFPAIVVDSAAAALREAGVVTAGGPDAGEPGAVRLAFRRTAAEQAASPVDSRLAEEAWIRDTAAAKEVVGTLEKLGRRLAKIFSPDDFYEQYSGPPPWEIGRPQSAMRDLAEAGAFRGRVLEVGCGTGEQALLAAAQGLPVLGVDMAPHAIEIARGKARERGLQARFLAGDVFELGKLGEQFDTVLDCCLFHLFDGPERVRYVDNLAAVMAPDAQLFLLCFSDRHPPGRGPHRVSQEEIRAVFADGWQVDAIEAVTLDNNYLDGVPAWLATITRTGVPEVGADRALARR